MDAWVVWAVLAVGLGILELLTLDLTLLMLAGGAAAGAATGWVGGPVWLQMLVAGATSVGLLGVVRPLALRHRRTPADLRTGSAALVGREALVIEDVTDVSGLIKLNGETWTARSFDRSTIPAGSTVQVLEIDGATARVIAS